MIKYIFPKAANRKRKNQSKIDPAVARRKHSKFSRDGLLLQTFEYDPEVDVDDTWDDMATWDDIKDKCYIEEMRVRSYVNTFSDEKWLKCKRSVFKNPVREKRMSLVSAITLTIAHHYLKYKKFRKLRQSSKRLTPLINAMLDEYKCSFDSSLEEVLSKINNYHVICFSRNLDEIKRSGENSDRSKKIFIVQTDDGFWHPIVNIRGFFDTRQLVRSLAKTARKKVLNV